jgi:hypothetical protein
LDDEKAYQFVLREQFGIEMLTSILDQKSDAPEASSEGGLAPVLGTGAANQ